VSVETGEDATARIRDEEDEVDSDGVVIKRRKRREKPSRKVHTAIFIPARKWGDYGKPKKWPFQTPLDDTYLRVCYSCARINTNVRSV
jgi:hypothetical protein